MANYGGAVEVMVDYCQFGERWRKRTKVLTTLPNASSVSRVCRGKVCSRTKLPHFLLEGRDPQGVFWTKRAEPYPFSFCRAIANAVAANT